MSRPLLALAAMVTLALWTAGCAAAAQDQGHSQGTVAGKFEREGGPISFTTHQTQVLPLPGTVTFTRDGKRVTAQVGRSGRFSVRLAAGTYEAVGRSPKIVEVSNNAVVGPNGKLISGSEHETACVPPVRVVVTPHHTISVVIACIVP